MKLSDISFPYPVLGVNDDIRPGLCEDAVVIKFDKKDHRSYKIAVSLRFDNPCIENLIARGMATYVCEVDCAKTNLRKAITHNEPQFSFDIDRKSVSGIVLLNCFVSVQKSIEGYVNPGFHEDYSGFKFNLSPGDILVGFPSRSFLADPKFDKLQSVTSFMQIRHDKDNEYTNFEFTDRTIDIKLPTALFNIYAAGVGVSCAEVIHSSIAYSALLSGLYEINNYRNSLWGHAIMQLVENNPQLKDAYEINEDGSIGFFDVTYIATVLLKDPYDRMLHKLDSINTQTSTFDD